MSDDKKCDLGSLFFEIAKHIENHDKKYTSYHDMKYPIEINSIEYKDIGYIKKIDKYVAVRPCSDNEDEKTFLGIYFGDMPIKASARLHNETGKLEIVTHCNPAIYVPKIERLVFGINSWWQFIKKPDDLKQITDGDINDVWYVKALKELDNDKKEAVDLSEKGVCGECYAKN